MWTIERLGPSRRYEVDEVLGHIFGGTPIFTRGSQSAMRLAIHCHIKEPPLGLRWIKAPPPDDLNRVAGLAKHHRGYARYHAQVEAAQ